MDNHSNANRCLSPVPAAKPQEKAQPEGSRLCDRIAFEAAHPHDWHFISQNLQPFPDRIACAIAREYRAILSSSGRFKANTFLRDTKPIAKEAGIALRADDEQIREMANNHSRQALHMLNIGSNHTPHDQYETLARYCRHMGITPPEPDEHKGGTRTLKGCSQRMTHATWWQKQLRRKLMQEREALMIRFGLVMKKDQKDTYCSREALRDHQDQSKRNAQILANTHITDGTNTITLADAAAATVANPEIRAAELMTRLRGWEELAKQAGLEMLFITVTCPSRMHSHYRNNGRKNPNYDGTLPNEAQQYLNACWGRARAKLQRHNIHYECFRVVEPHHDGTPHWHLAMAVDPNKADDLVAIIEDYFTREDPDDRGIENRVKTEEIHTSLAGYLAKYISKNIDGAHVDKDFNGHDAKHTAQSVRAWASLWNIRQFQQLGGPSVTVYRELRRIRDISKVPESMLAVWEAANTGDWAAYVKAQGGFNTPRDSHLVKLAKLWNESTNRYGEVMGWQIIGVEAGDDYLNTRPKEWTVVSSHVQTSDSLARALAAAMGTNRESIAHYEAYAATLAEGWMPPSLTLGGSENPLPDVPSVQLFSRGQGVSLTAPVAPTGAEKRQPNAPPEPETPPLWAYDDHQTAATGYPEATGCPAEYEDYAEYLDGMGDPAPMRHGHVA